MRLLWIVPLLITALAPLVAADPPTLVGALTGGDGAVEHIDLRFSDDVLLRSTVPSDFSISACACAPADLAVIGTNEVRLTLTVPLADTAAQPTVRYSAPADGLRGAGGDAVASFNVIASDGTAPTALSATAWGIGRSDAVLVFSEPVSWKGNAAEGLTKADLGFEDLAAGGATAIDGVIHQAKTARVDLVLRGGFAAGDDGVDRVRVLGDAVVDQAGNVAAASGADLVLDRVPPGGVELLRATSTGSSSIALEVGTPPDEDVDRLEVRMSTEEFAVAEFSQQRLVPGAPTKAAPRTAYSVDVERLDAGQHYYFAAQVLDRNGNRGPVSHVVAATTQRDTFPPAPPSGLQIPPGGTGTRWLGLSWTVPADHDSTPIERYEIRLANGKAADPASGKFIEAPSPLAPGLTQRFLIGGLEPGRLYTVAMRSLDAAGMISGWVVLEAATATDETPPEGALEISSSTHTGGVPSERSVLDVAWNGASDDGSPVIYLYRIDHSPTTRLGWTDAWTQDTKLVGHVLGDGRWFVHVAALSAGGQVEAEPFEVVVDRDAPPPPAAPRLVAAGYGQLTVRLDASPDAVKQELRWSREPITDADWDSATPAGWVASSGELTVAGLPPEVQVHLAARASDAAGRPSAVGPALAAAAFLDPTPPSGSLNFRSDTHGNPASARRVDVTWSPAMDNETSVVYHVAYGQDPNHVVDEEDGRQSATRLGFDVDRTGDWFVHVRARSAGGWGEQATFTFQVLAPAADALVQARSLAVTVERTENGNLLRWTKPAGADLLGVQVWAANSPFVLVGDVILEDSDGAYLHAGPEARSTTRYVVTGYFTRDAAGGYLNSAPEALQGVAAATSQDGISLPMLAGSGLAAATLVGVALGGWWLLRRRKEAVPGHEPIVPSAPEMEEDPEAVWENFSGDEEWAMDEAELGLDTI